MTSADEELRQWLSNGDMAKYNERGPGKTAVPVVVMGQRVASKPGTWQGSEHDLQTAVFQWAHDSGLPELAMMFAIPNGGHRHPAVAAKMKMEGVCAGVPDICVAVARGGYHGLYIELKVGRNQPTEAQRDWLARLAAHGYKTAVCRDLESVQELVVGYLAA